MGSKEIVASSKTLIKASGMVADALGIDPEYTGSPAADFARLVDQIRNEPEIDEGQISEIAEKFYRIGVRAGLRLATDLMVEGHFFMKGPQCFSEGNLKTTRKLKLPDGTWREVKFDYSPKELGFG